MKYLIQFLSAIGILLFSSLALIKNPLTSLHIHNIFGLKQKSPVVITICMSKGNGGMEHCALAQNREINKTKTPSVFICKKNSFIERELKKENLPYVSCSHFRMTSDFFTWMPGVQTALEKIILLSSGNILAVHCNHKREIGVAKKLTKNKKIPIFFTQHTPTKLSTSVRSSADCIIAVSEEIQKDLTLQNTKDHVENSIVTIPPFFNTERLFSFKKPLESRHNFFEKNFNINLKNCPVLLKVAHLYSDIHHKNHPLLFKAMAELIHNRKTPVQALLAGHGKNLELYKKIVQSLNISQYVHFLGNVENPSALFYFADVNLLTSSKEAFGISLVEGGFMEKPTMIAHSTGAANWLIKDSDTGFLFKNGDAQDLADTISYVLKNPTEATRAGKALKKLIITDFMPEKSARRLITLYYQLREKM